MKIPDYYRTSKRIKFATDDWGGDGSATHIEIDWQGETLMVDIKDDHIHICGPIMAVKQTSINACDIVPNDQNKSTEIDRDLTRN